MLDNSISLPSDDPPHGVDGRGLARTPGVVSYVLHESCHVITAGTATEAIENFDDTVDVAFLDRRLPDASGDHVLEQIRARGDCKVAMLTAIEPDFDIVDI